MLLSKKKIYELDKLELEKIFETESSNGISKEDAVEKLTMYGQNILSEAKKQTFFQKFLHQFVEPTTIILIVAAVVSFFIHEYKNTIAIVSLVFLNAIIGFIQEHKAEAALQAIKKITAPRAKVIRDGLQQEIDAVELVPGDIVVLEAGDYVPADMRLIEVSDIKIDESALTGESIPVDKTHEYLLGKAIPIADQRNMAFMSTLVTYGHAKGIVVATAKETEIGKIARLLDETSSTKTPLQLKLSEISKILTIIAIIICIIIFLIGFFQGQNLYDITISAFSLAIAAVPEGMPLIVTVVLAMGIRDMAHNHAIMKNLLGIETAGSANIVLSDKTGTLTQNKMTVTELFVNNSVYRRKTIPKSNAAITSILSLAVLNNDTTIQQNNTGSYELLGDPTEIALSQLAIDYGINPLSIIENSHRIQGIPFDSTRKMMTTVHRTESNITVSTKGAPEAILNISSFIELEGKISPLSQEIKDAILIQNDDFTQRALRVIAIGYKIISQDELESNCFENNLIFVGLLAMIDPPKLEAKQTIQELRKAGIETGMITGDNKLTATAIAKELDLSDNIAQTITGPEIDLLSSEQLNERIQQYRVFARVTPEHKLKIVEAFQNKGNVVTMIGDGVNDAPALKKADIGVAMGAGGTEVAKGAADMILGDDNFSTISYAIKYGRQAYDNIKKSIHIMLCGNIAEIVGVFLATLLGVTLFDTPIILLSAIQILWINVVSDTLLSIALGMEPLNPDMITRKPRQKYESFFGNGFGLKIGWHGIMIGTLTFIVFAIGFYSNHENLAESISTANTMAFMTLTFCQFFHAFNLKSETESIFSIQVLSNKPLIIFFVLNTILQISTITVPFLRETVFNLNWLTINEWIVVFIATTIPVVIIEVQKIFLRIKIKKRDTTSN